MRKWILRLLVVAVVITLAVAVRFWFLAQDPVEVTVTAVDRGTVEETITNSRAGTVKAHRRTRLSPESGGMATSIPFHEGQTVKRGEVVLALDDSLQRARLTLARRELESTQARRTQSCVQAARTAQELVRIRRLFEQKVVPEDRLDDTRAAAEAAKAACDAADADVSRARSAVALAQVEVDKMVLRAPFDGVVADVSIEVGEWTSPSPPALPIPPVIDLIDPTSIYISAPMDEVDAARLEVDQRGRVTVDSHRGRSFWGTVVRVSPFVLDIEAQNRTVEIDVELDDASLASTLKPGTSADVEIVLETHPDTPRIPTSALFEGNKVLVVEGDRLSAREVQLGLKNWNWTEVLDGLAPGDRVVSTLDRAEIKPGALVVVRELGETERAASPAAES